MLECTNSPNGRCAGVQRLHRFLEEYVSEYHYLFACIHKAAFANGNLTIEECYSLPNMARRLLEAFLAFRRPKMTRQEFRKALDDLKGDAANKLRVERFLQTHSHVGMLAEPEHDLSLLSEAQAILKDLLDLMKAEDGAHYSAMETLVQSLAAEDTETNTEESE